MGVDIGSQEHFARAFDWRGFEFSKRAFKFGNTNVGFLSFLRWLEETQGKTGMKKIIVGCEPTGCYWLGFQKFLQDHDVLLVTVNPYSVKKCKELDDNSPEKSDLKDPKTIAGLVKDGRFSTSYLPTGVYAEIREAFVCREQIMKQHVRLSNVTCPGASTRVPSDFMRLLMNAIDGLNRFVTLFITGTSLISSSIVMILELPMIRTR